jgi:hypothetical protein
VADDLGLYTPDERAIFELPGGRRFDPLAAQRLLTLASKGKVYQASAALRAEPLPDGPEREQQLIGQATAEAILVAAARVAFEMPPFPEATDAEALAARAAFWEWLEKKGGPAATSPTSRPSTDSPPAG